MGKFPEGEVSKFSGHEGSVLSVWYCSPAKKKCRYFGVFSERLTIHSVPNLGTNCNTNSRDLRKNITLVSKTLQIPETLMCLNHRIEPIDLWLQQWGAEACGVQGVSKLSIAVCIWNWTVVFFFFLHASRGGFPSQTNRSRLDSDRHSCGGTILRGL